MVGGWLTPRPGQFSPGKETRYAFYRSTGWTQEQVLTGAENIAPTGVRFPDRAARSESLYRLRFPGLLGYVEIKIINLEFSSIVIKSVSSVHVQRMSRQTKKMDVAGIRVALGVLLTVSVLCMEINTGPEHCSLYLGVHRQYLFHFGCVGFRESS